jgi:hypothetical protein
MYELAFMKKVLPRLRLLTLQRPLWEYLESIHMYLTDAERGLLCWNQHRTAEQSIAALGWNESKVARSKPQITEPLVLSFIPQVALEDAHVMMNNAFTEDCHTFTMSMMVNECVNLKGIRLLKDRFELQGRFVQCVI